jgi:hypothetical protein
MSTGFSAATGATAVSLLVFGQAIDPNTPMGWVSNISGIGLAVFMVIRFGGAIDKLTEAITGLRMHCAAKIGEPDDKKG